MADLTAWLTAQMDEHEQVAGAALELAPGPWAVNRQSPDLEVLFPLKRGAPIPPDPLSGLWGQVVGWSNDREHYGTVAQHIALHDPAAVLADIAAKRALIELHMDSHLCSDRCDMMRLLASAYAHRTGYREEWGP